MDGQEGRRREVRRRLVEAEYPEDVLPGLCREWGIDARTWGRDLRYSPMPTSVAEVILRDVFDPGLAGSSALCLVCSAGMHVRLSCRGNGCPCRSKSCRRGAVDGLPG